MTKNTVLNITIVVLRLLKFFIGAGAIAMTIFFVYVQVDSSAFADYELDSPNQLFGFGYYASSNSTFHTDQVVEKQYTLSQLKTVSLYILYVKTFIIAVLTFLSIQNFEKILLSVRSFKTFSTQNVRLFRKIGVYIIWIAILSSYSILRFESGTKIRWSLTFFPLLYALLAFVFAEVFKEGSRLKQENDLTI